MSPGRASERSDVCVASALREAANTFSIFDMASFRAIARQSEAVSFGDGDLDDANGGEAVLLEKRSAGGAAGGAAASTAAGAAASSAPPTHVHASGCSACAAQCERPEDA